jgi:uncharacterized damage-inducible protein DinB
MPTPLSSLLDEAVELWTFARDGVIAEAEVVPADRFDWRPTDKSRSVAELILHIVEAGLMGAGELTRADGDFLRVPYPEIVAEHVGDISNVSGRDALIDLLHTSFETGRSKFEEAGELAMLQSIRRFDGVRGTRLAWLYHMVDHESYHRGQLALYVRQLGRVPALTQAILGES